MSLQVDEKAAPKDARSWHTKFAYEQTGDLSGLEILDAPFVRGEFRQIEGWLQGIGAGPIQGTIEIVLQEGFTTMTGQVSIYSKDTGYCIQVLAKRMNAVMIGISNAYPTTSIRIKATYNLQWSKTPA